MPERTTHILGISCFYHDAAACLVTDGEIVAAAEEERFTRRKHDPSFPANAIAFCLAEGGIDIRRLDHVVFHEKPFIKFERIAESFVASAPRGVRTFLNAIPTWAKEKLFVADILSRETGYAGRCLFTSHHEAHAASAYYPSPFSEAAILTIDGVGEWATAAWGTGLGNEIALGGELRFPHSLGMLYSAFTCHLGFKVNSGEYKVMGLAPYGEPVYRDQILSELLDLKEDGSFRLNMEYFDYVTGRGMTSKRFDRLFGGPPRAPEGEITRGHMDLARSIQAVTEEIVLRMARHVRRETGMTRLCMAGGVALNCAANGRLLREGIFDEIWVQPAAGDAAGALGAALLVWHRRLGEPRPQRAGDGQKGTRLGPAYGDEEIASFLEGKGIPFRKLTREELTGVTSRLLAEGKVVGWFQGRMEFGPRALGSRSILGDPRLQGMQSLINRKIKFRESFRPFAPTVLREHAREWFEMERDSPYMSFTFPVRPEKRCSAPAGDHATGPEKPGAPRSVIPAVTHVDGSSRVQTLAREDDPLFYDLVEAFRARTGCAMVVNTSLNVRGEPIVRTPDEATACFLRTEMDHLVLGSFLLDKKEMRSVNTGGDGGNTDKTAPNDPSRGDVLKFSAALMVVLEGIAALQFRRGRAELAMVLGIAGAVPLALGLLLPRTMRIAQRAVTRLASVIGRINIRLLLGLVFFLILTPAAVFLRLVRPDAMRRNFEPGAGSYWEKAPGAQWSADRYDRMY